MQINHNEIIKIDVVSDFDRLKAEVNRLQKEYAELQQERDELVYHVCPELEAIYYREIGDLENTEYVKQLHISELMHKIEMLQAVLNRAKKLTVEEIEEETEEEFREYQKEASKRFEEAERKKEEQRKREQQKAEREAAYEERKKQNAESAAGEKEQDTDVNGDGGAACSDDTEKSGEGGEEADTNGSEKTACDDENGYAAEGNPDEGQDDAQREKNEEDSEKKPEGDPEKSPEKEQEEEMTFEQRLKFLYRSIVKKFHPDVNPNMTEREKELFLRAQQAYKESDLDTLQEIYDELFQLVPDEMTENEDNFKKLLELKEKLIGRIAAIKKEIEGIKEDFPYNIKSFIENGAAMALKKEVIQQRIDKLDEVLKALVEKWEELNEEFRQQFGQDGQP